MQCGGDKWGPVFMLLQVGEALSALANTTTLVTQELALPAKSCAVITNGRVVVVNNPKDPSSQPTGMWGLTATLAAIK